MENLPSASKARADDWKGKRSPRPCASLPGTACDPRRGRDRRRLPVARGRKIERTPCSLKAASSSTWTPPGVSSWTPRGAETTRRPRPTSCRVLLGLGPGSTSRCACVRTGTGAWASRAQRRERTCGRACQGGGRRRDVEPRLGCVSPGVEFVSGATSSPGTGCSAVSGGRPEAKLSRVWRTRLGLGWKRLAIFALCGPTPARSRRGHLRRRYPLRERLSIGNIQVKGDASAHEGSINLKDQEALRRAVEAFGKASTP